MAVAALKGDKTVAEIAQTHGIHPTMVTQWKGRLEKEAAQVFEGKSRAGEPPVDVDALYWRSARLRWRESFQRRGHGSFQPCGEEGNDPARVPQGLGGPAVRSLGGEPLQPLPDAVSQARPTASSHDGHRPDLHGVPLHGVAPDDSGPPGGRFPVHRSRVQRLMQLMDLRSMAEVEIVDYH